ncbi:MAG: hypothetical protein IPI65_16220 [Bacteroidetes bacterium]|nr:hypothetical protein [Bacteroidota bacterium]
MINKTCEALKAAGAKRVTHYYYQLRCIPFHRINGTARIDYMMQLQH